MPGGLWRQFDLNRVAGRLRRTAPVAIATTVFGTMILLFVGCWWRDRNGAGGPKIEGPPDLNVDRQVRVRLISRQPRKSEEFAVSGPFTLTDAVDGRVLTRRDAGLPNCIVRPASPKGILLGDFPVEAADVVVSPDRDASLVLDGSTYRGLMRIRREGDGVTFTNVVDVESYLRGVLRGELPRHFHAESFKTLAVAARTYVLYQKLIGGEDRAYDVLDHEGSQMYIGVRGEDPVAVKAVEATRGEVLTYGRPGNEKIFCTYYSSTCGGLSQAVTNVKTSEVLIPPLGGNVVCNDCQVSPSYRWGPVKIAKADLTKRIVARYPTVSKIGLITALVPKALTSDGRIISIQLVGSGGDNETLVGEDFRLAVGSRALKSTNFVIQTLPDAFVFKDGKGFGHGMGLCQFGADTKACRGMGYREILATYYPRSVIKKLW